MDFKEIIVNGQRVLNYANGLSFLKKNNIELTCVKWNSSYDELLLKHIQQNETKNETDFIKNGIIELLDALRKTESIVLSSQNEIRKQLYNKYHDITEELHFNRIPMSKERFSEWLDENSESGVKHNLKMKEYAVSVLNYEIFQFKIKLGRLNTSVIMKNNNVEFIENNKKQEMIISYRDIIENPYPKIFKDTEAFLLFQEFHSIYKENGNPLADYSFIYRAMYKDKFINQEVTPKMFIELINSKPYGIEYLSKLKGVAECLNNKEKISIYSYLTKTRIRA